MTPKYNEPFLTFYFELLRVSHMKLRDKNP